MEKPKKRDTVKAARIKKTAELTGVSDRSVRRVINGDQDNPTVMQVYLELEEGENALLTAVKQLVPF